MTVTTPVRPMVVDEVEVVDVRRLSPSFVRLVLAGSALGDVGVDGPLYDQRIKLIFPPASGVLPSLGAAEDSWYSAWAGLPVAERGDMRTYTVRALRGRGDDTRLVVDIVLHPDDGDSGPGARWAAAAVPGDRLVIVAPRRGVPFGGIEFAPGPSRQLLLAGDETAVPAISAIVECLPDDARGAAFVEVPHAADVRGLTEDGRLACPAGVDVVWLPRDGAPLGERLHAAVAAHLRAGGVDRGEPVGSVSPVSDDEVDPDLWETPTYSSSGEATSPAPPSVAPVAPRADLYAWIAGESKVVTGLRRHLVRDLGIDRRQVAFMGYWRRGVAMRS